MSDQLEARVAQAAEAALADHHYVSAVDLLLGMGWLNPARLRDWREGRAPCLERVVQANLHKLTEAMRCFRRWAVNRDLKPSETFYTSHGSRHRRPLRFSVSGNHEIERAYRTHYISPVLTERKRQKLEARIRQPPELAVFQLITDSICGECGRTLGSGSMLWKEGEKGLCLNCADLDHLVFLPRGDAALTRRAGKHSSGLKVVVLKFSRARERYERQGILATESAVALAEVECDADAAVRTQRRKQSVIYRNTEDARLIERMTTAIRELYPGCPAAEAREIARHTARRGSGTIGRTAAGRELDPAALRLAVIAAVRHRHTPYDELLMTGTPRLAARDQVRERVDAVLQAWETGRQ